MDVSERASQAWFKYKASACWTFAAGPPARRKVLVMKPAPHVDHVIDINNPVQMYPLESGNAVKAEAVGTDWDIYKRYYLMFYPDPSTSSIDHVTIDTFDAVGAQCDDLIALIRDMDLTNCIGSTSEVVLSNKNGQPNERILKFAKERIGSGHYTIDTNTGCAVVEFTPFKAVIVSCHLVARIRMAIENGTTIDKDAIVKYRGEDTHTKHGVYVPHMTIGKNLTSQQQQQRVIKYAKKAAGGGIGKRGGRLVLSEAGNFEPIIEKRVSTDVNSNVTSIR